MTFYCLIPVIKFQQEDVELKSSYCSSPSPTGVVLWSKGPVADNHWRMEKAGGGVRSADHSPDNYIHRAPGPVHGPLAILASMRQNTDPVPSQGKVNIN